MNRNRYVVEEIRDHYTGDPRWLICWISNEWNNRSAPLFGYSYKTKEAAERTCSLLNKDYTEKAAVA